MSEVALLPEVTIKKSSQEELAMRVMEKSEKACLISNSITAKVIMTPAVHMAKELANQVN